ncbi:hypothetical protein [aff. Roholtiella sp. LEGE 12411]|uniref:hypothetical protein n=1 Tax=aff. Roholtiella sp. LEGE 12411 TaxID=1828822 RepID=UPI001880B271|nr:hypothetical protein [aff. Roholtiella sp. LEGE 12411]MBE9037183.1 hypothetical protein [aff. Roholtiella sp. LEGE 12411]
MIIYPDCILIEAAGWQEGFKEKLPNDGKYEGKGCWKYPASMKDTFTQGGYPAIRMKSKTYSEENTYASTN